MSTTIDRHLSRNLNATVTFAALRVLRHTLGVGHHIRRTSWGYRNHYVCGTGGATPEIRQLVDAGLMERVPQERVTTSGDVYRATLAGAQLVGVSHAQTKRLGLLGGSKP